MAVNYETFIEGFPEFAEVEKPYVERKIAEATRQVDTAVWRDKADDGISYLAAHLLALSPFGQNARLVPPNAKATRDEALTTYEREYQRMVRMVASGFRVVGDC